MRPSSSLPLPLALVVVATFVLTIAASAADEHVVVTTAPPPTAPLAASPPPPQPSPATSSPPPPPPPLVNPPAPWSPVTNVNDRTIQQVGKFAVHAYCLNTGAQLAFVSVVGGQTQPYGGGARYQLVIAVAAGAGPGAKTARYSVSVWGILGTTTWQLWSFAPAKN